MWSEQFSRSDFADLVGRLERRERPRVLARFREPVAPPVEQSLWAIWPAEKDLHTGFPVVLVVRDDQLRDFLAWAATFFAGFRPFTSFFRVVTWSTFDASRGMKQDPSLGELENACVGAIVGEALTEARSRTQFDSLPIKGFASTYSFVMSRALAVNGRSEILDLVATNWSFARELTSQPMRRLPQQQLDDTWRIVRALHSGHVRLAELRPELEPVANACRELQSSASLSANSWRILSGAREEYEILRRAMSERKESRVRIFEKVALELPPDTDGSIRSGFLCGHLASLVGEGTLDHSDLVAPFLEKMPTALLWYGICAGFFASSRLGAEKGGLGRRLLRDLLQPDTLLSRPETDISIAELEVLFSVDRDPSRFLQRSSASISVELAPAVNVPLRWPPKRSEPPVPQTFDAIDADVAAATLKQLGVSLEKALALHEALAAQLQSGESDESEAPASKSRRRKGGFGNRG